jgi:hypothetical protein
MEGEATVNPPTQSPYTLRTERGLQLTEVKLIATGVTPVEDDQGGKTSLYVTLF